MKYTLGLDLGIGSIGWALMLQNDEGDFIRIEDCGVRIFETIDSPKDGSLANQMRRTKRGQRRLRRRKQQRLEDFKRYYKNKYNIQLNEINRKTIQEKYQEISESKYLPYFLKIKGLTEKLSIEEIGICIYHYLMYRGFKSNRKNQDKKEDGVILEGITKVREKMQAENITVSQYILKHLINNSEDHRIHNQSQNYQFTFSRSMYCEELMTFLNKQIEFNVIDEDLKERVLNEKTGFFSRQRNFAEGPACGPYAAKEAGVKLALQTLGKCIFDDNYRAPKAAFSAEKFVMLSFLNNLNYKDDNHENYTRFTKEEIQKIYNIALEKKLTYELISKIANLSNPRFKKLDITKKKYIEEIKKYKNSNNLVSNADLTDEQWKEFNKILEKVKLQKEIPHLKNFLSYKKELLKSIDKNLLINLKDEDYDNLVLYSYLYDSDFASLELKKLGYNEQIIANFLEIEMPGEAINLSLDLCTKMNKLLLDGYIYDKALKELKIDHRMDYSLANIKKQYCLPTIDRIFKDMQILSISPTVKQILVEARKVINAIIFEYKLPNTIRIELSREAKNSFKARKEIEKSQKENFEDNNDLKFKLMKEYPSKFRSFNNIKRNDVIQYRLFEEQAHHCSYCNVEIKKEYLYDGVSYQIDHIIPISRSYDDSFRNKTLVCTKCNQNKKNLIPYEFLKGDFKEFSERIEQNRQISRSKKDIYLMKEINEEEFENRNLNDTSYASKLVKDIIGIYLKTENVEACNGSITSLLKTVWGLSNLTHSLISKDLEKLRSYKFDFPKIFIEKDIIKVALIEKTIQDKAIFEFPLYKEKPKQSYDEILFNNTIMFIKTHLEQINNEFLNSDDFTIEEYQIKFTENMKNSPDINQFQMYENLSLFISYILVKLTQYLNEKDRSNHLHHVTDAIVIASSDKSIIQRTTKYLQQRYDYKNNKDKQDEAYVHLNKHVPMPYELFRRDVKNRVYQRDYSKLMQEIDLMNNYLYMDENIKNQISVIYPSKSPLIKTTGALHKETVYGKKFDNTLNKYVLTKKVDIKTLKNEQLKDIYNRKSGNKLIAEKLEEWLNQSNRDEYPFIYNGDEKHYIKKVRLIETEKVESKILISDRNNNEKYVESEKVVRIDVYRKKETNVIYFVPINMHKISAKDVKTFYQIFCGNGNSNIEFITKENLIFSYDLINSIPKNSLIEIYKKNDSAGLCYSCGFTSGSYEVKSILGDSYDLIPSLFDNFNSDMRFRIPVTSIVDIRVKKISILGKISE